jgi:AMOP domain
VIRAARFRSNPFVAQNLFAFCIPAAGDVSFLNLPSRTIIFRAQGSQNAAGLVGANPLSGSTVTIVMSGFEVASNGTNKDFSQGLSGWIFSSSSAASIGPHVEAAGPKNATQRRKLQLNNDLYLSTNPVVGPTSASYTFKSSDGACAVEVRYRFVTSEVPGGYFGSRFNDYFSVSIRSKQAQKSVQEANSMNGLGLAAFDFSSGSTSWRKAVLPLKKSLFIFIDEVQVDLVVANVGDGALQSQVIVDFVKEVFESTGGTGDDQCACARCEEWYNREIKDTSWIDQLPACPCTVVTGVLPCTVRPSGSDVNTGTINGVDWDTDKAKSLCGTVPFVKDYHPGADVCIRGGGPGGTTQQCCYANQGTPGTYTIVQHGTPAAGTPDRNFPNHIESDVDTADDCIFKCPSLKDKYIGTTGGVQGARSDPRHTTTGCAKP